MEHENLNKTIEMIYQWLSELKVANDNDSIYKVRLINSFASFYLQASQRCLDLDEKDRYMIKYNQYLNKASEESYLNSYTWRVKGLVNISKSDFKTAESEFLHVLDDNPNDTFSLYWLAIIEFKRNNPK